MIEKLRLVRGAFQSLLRKIHGAIDVGRSELEERVLILSLNPADLDPRHFLFFSIKLQLVGRGGENVVDILAVDEWLADQKPARARNALRGIHMSNLLDHRLAARVE